MLTRALALGLPALTAPWAIAFPGPHTPLSEAWGSFTGISSQDQAGCSVAGVGDVNGDGLDDLLIGAWGADGEETMAGAVYLVLGRADSPGADVSLEQADSVFLGQSAGDLTGLALAGPGDVNGDGLDDMLIAAPGRRVTHEAAGEVYLVLGREAADWGGAFSLASAEASFAGGEHEARLGLALGRVGDLDGDGLDDIAIGAPHWGLVRNHHSQGQGIVGLWFGRETGWESPMPLLEGDLQLQGREVGEQLGIALAGGADLTGDGLDDLVVGAAGHPPEERGGALVWPGRSREAWLLIEADSGSAQASLGESANDRAGEEVAVAADADGDGVADLFVAAPNNRDRGTVPPEWGGSGQIYMVAGRPGSRESGPHLSRADASLWGECLESMAGQGLADAGDVNGDGLSDLLVGSLGTDDTVTEHGLVTLVLGRDSGWARDLRLEHESASFVGTEESGEIGTVVAGLGDFNGDGRADFAIGSPNANSAGSNAGRVSIFSCPDPWSAAEVLARERDALQAARDGSEWGEAARRARRVLLLSPGDGDALEALAESLLESGGRDAVLAECVRRLVRREGAPELEILAETDALRGAAEIPFGELAEAVDLDPWRWHAIADALYDDSRNTDALLCWDRALTGLQSVEFHFGRHRALMRLERFDEALEAAEASRDIDADHGFGWVYTGDAHRALGDREDAIEAYRRALDSPVDGGSHGLARSRLEGMVP